MQRTPVRIDCLPNDFNGFLSAFDVSVYRTDVRDFVIITEPDDNPGPSITNSAETACPQIAEQLDLAWERCVFIEHYPPNKRGSAPERLDPTFDRICFSGPIASKVYQFTPGARQRAKTIPIARLAGRGWQPLSLPLAEALQAAGLEMSGLIGREVEFWDSHNRRGGRYRVSGYDGRRYYTAGGEFIGQDICRVCRDEIISIPFA